MHEATYVSFGHEERADGLADGRAGRRAGEQTDARADGRADEQTSVRAAGRRDRRTDDQVELKQGK